MAKTKTKKEDEIDISEVEERAQRVMEEVVIPERIKESVKAKKEMEELISTEEELLDFFSDDRRKIRLEYQGKVFEFHARPITSVKDLDVFNFDLSIYADMTSNDQMIFEKMRRGEKLSEEQEKRYQELIDEYGTDIAGNVLERIDRILAEFVTPPDFGGDIKKREEFWSKADFMFKTVLFNQVQERIGLVDEAEVRLFQTR